LRAIASSTAACQMESFGSENCLIRAMGDASHGSWFPFGLQAASAVSADFRF
jgi:hypothetical protein